MFSYGETIGGYRVISRFSSDDTSSLYLAEPSEREGRGLVALRVWEHIHLVEAGSREAFLAEIGELVRLRHPHMLLVFDYGIEQEKPYIVIEHYDPPLVRLTERLEQGSFSEEQALTTLTGISEALYYAHQERVAHGRLTPDSVYLDAGDQVVLEFPLTTLSKTGSQEEGVLKGELSDQSVLADLAHVLFNGHPLPDTHVLESTVPDTVRPIIAKTLTEMRLERSKRVEDFSQSHTSEEGQGLSQKTDSPPPKPGSSGESEIAVGKGYKALRRSRGLQVLSLVLLMLFWLALASPLINRNISAPSAKITITPASKHLKNSYIITAVQGVADASRHEIQARHLKAAANASAPVFASGQGHEELAFAKGKLMLSNVSQVVENVNSLSLTVNGVTAVLELIHPNTKELINLRPGESYELDTRIQLEGSFGNIPARFFDGDHFFLVTDVLGISSFSFTAHIENQAPFSGGKDGGDYIYLQKQDIDSIAQPMIKTLTASALKDVKQQIQPDEEPFVTGVSSENITCSVNHTGNKVNDRVLDGTLVIEVTCETDVYIPQQAMMAASTWQKGDAIRQLGAQYQLAGVLRTTLDKSQILVFGSDVLHIPVTTEGLWVYQFQADQLRELAQSVSGKAQEDALNLLRNQPGIANSTIAISSLLGTALPWSVEKIEITASNVPGLQTGWRLMGEPCC